MIRLRLDVADVQRMRFAYSPRTEIAEILYRLHDTTAHPLLGSWLAGTRRVLHPPDVDLLRALAPARGNIANFLGPGAADTSTTVDDQLRFVSQCDPERLRDDLTRICRGLLPHDLQLELDGNDLPKRAAEVRDTCWRLALEPPAPGCSPSSRPTSRTGMRRLVSGGLAAPLEDLHDVSMSGESIDVLAAPPDSEHRLPGSGLLIVPSVFTWPDLVADPGRTGSPSITYGAPGIGALWQDEVLVTPGTPSPPSSCAPGQRSCAPPKSASARRTSPASETRAPAPSAPHLTALRDAGMLASSRSGRRVLYQQTPLAASVIEACRREPDPADPETTYVTT